MFVRPFFFINYLLRNNDNVNRSYKRPRLIGTKQTPSWMKHIRTTSFQKFCLNTKYPRCYREVLWMPKYKHIQSDLTYMVPSIVLFIPWGEIIQNNFLSKIQNIFYSPDECDIIIIHRVTAILYNLRIFRCKTQT